MGAFLGLAAAGEVERRPRRPPGPSRGDPRGHRPFVRRNLLAGPLPLREVTLVDTHLVETQRLAAI